MYVPKVSEIELRYESAHGLISERIHFSKDQWPNKFQKVYNSSVAKLQEMNGNIRELYWEIGSRYIKINKGKKIFRQFQNALTNVMTANEEIPIVVRVIIIKKGKKIVNCIMENQPGKLMMKFELQGNITEESYDWPRAYDDFVKQAQKFFEMKEENDYELKDGEGKAIQAWEDFRARVTKFYNKKTKTLQCTLYIKRKMSILIKNWCDSNDFGRMNEALQEQNFYDPLEFANLTESQLNDVPKIASMTSEDTQKFLEAVKKLKINMVERDKDNKKDEEELKDVNSISDNPIPCDYQPCRLQGILFDTPGIQSLSDEKKKKITDYLAQLKNCELSEFLKEELSEEQIKTINDELQHRCGDDDYDLLTVVSEIITFNRESTKRFMPEEKLFDNVDTSVIFKEITDKRLELINKLKQDTNYLNSCLYHLIKANYHINGGSKDPIFWEVTDRYLLQGGNSLISNITGQLYELSQLYKSLKDVISPGKILSSIVLEANYDRLVQKQKNIAVFELMELLNKAFDSIKSIKGQNLVLFMGDTGAGKSTSVNYFSGVPLESFTDEYGQYVVKVPEQAQTSKHAIIGQALGTSQTSIVQAYNISLNNYNTNRTLLADFPGFDDTRGGHFNLCTALSIDQTIQIAGSIQAVVINIPFTDFITKRATLVVALFQKLRARIPDLFQADYLPLLDDRDQHSYSGVKTLFDISRFILQKIKKPKDHKPNWEQHCQSMTQRDSIFLLITKHEKFSKEREAMGARISQYLREAYIEYENLMQTVHQQNQTVDPLHLDSSIEKIAIWRLLFTMYQQGHIHFIDVSNKVQRKKYLYQYINAPGIQKNRFYKAMDGQKEQQLWKNVEIAVNTWRVFVMEQYLKGIPLDMKQINDRINNKKKEIEDLKTHNSQCANDIDNLKKSIQSTKDRQNVLLDKLNDPDYEKKPEIMNQLKEYYVELDHSTETNLKDQLIELDHEFEKEQKYYDKYRDQIAVLKKEIGTIQNEINELRTKVDRLSEGSIQEVLYEYTCKSRHMYLYTLKPGAHETAIKEIRELTENEYEPGAEKVRVRGYKGILLHTVCISRDYRVLPKDEIQKKLFIQKIKASGQAESGGYIADLIGANYKLRLGVNPASDGKKIAYSIETNWNGRDIPWFQIVYTIPNVDRNESAIINANARISGSKYVLALKEANLRETEKELISRKNKMNSLTQKKTQLTQEQKNLEEIRKKKEINNTITRIKEESKNLIRTYAGNIMEKIERQYSNKQNLDRIQENIKNEKYKLSDLEKKKRHFAIMIQTQKDISKQLVTFAKRILQDKGYYDADEVKHKKLHQSDELLSECQKFLDYYYQHQEQLFQECHQDIRYILEQE